MCYRPIITTYSAVRGCGLKNEALTCPVSGASKETSSRLMLFGIRFLPTPPLSVFGALSITRRSISRRTKRSGKLFQASEPTLSSTTRSGYTRLSGTRPHTSFIPVVVPQGELDPIHEVQGVLCHLKKDHFCLDRGVGLRIPSAQCGKSQTEKTARTNS
jgi:hypothetical protein